MKINRLAENKIVWFRGEQVILNGEKERIYGGDFFNGIYLTGNKKLQPVQVHVSTVRLYVDLSAA